MRPGVLAWLVRHGVPGWLAPDYAMMVGLAALLGAIFVLPLVRRDGEDPRIQGRALLLAYAAALVGGFAFESLRALPVAIAVGSPAPVLFAGRAAYGGLLAALLVPALYLRHAGRSVTGFFDRAIIPMGLSFAFVRIGCFLEGCDYGRPTALPWGVRFPAGSLAAEAHAAAGWVPDGAPSLPVHPTELYESALGLFALALALPVLLRRRERDGRAFAVWMATYAVGRFALEMLRADADRGVYLGLSSAQYVSLAILAPLSVAALWRRRARAVVVAATLAALTLAPRSADAKPPTVAPAPAPKDALKLTDGTRVVGKIIDVTPGDHATLQLPDGQIKTYPWSALAGVEMSGVLMTYDTPAPAPAPAAPPAPAPPPAPASAAALTPTPASDDTTASPQHDRRLTVRATLVSSITLARPDVPSGLATELDALYRVRLGSSSRLEVGLEGRMLENVEATEWSLGVPLELVLETGHHLEITFDLVLFNTWFVWAPDASLYYATTNAYGMRLAGGAQLAIGGHTLLGLSPLAFNTISSETVGVITAYEPRVWLGVDF